MRDIRKVGMRYGEESDAAQQQLLQVESSANRQTGTGPLRQAERESEGWTEEKWKAQGWG